MLDNLKEKHPIIYTQMKGAAGGAVVAGVTCLGMFGVVAHARENGAVFSESALTLAFVVPACAVFMCGILFANIMHCLKPITHKDYVEL